MFLRPVSQDIVVLLLQCTGAFVIELLQDIVVLLLQCTGAFVIELLQLKFMFCFITLSFHISFILNEDSIQICVTYIITICCYLPVVFK